MAVINAAEKIDGLLKQLGAQGFMRGWDDQNNGLITFRMKGIDYKITVGLPKKADYGFTANGRKRTTNSQFEAWNDACKDTWREFYDLIHAKMLGIQRGITKFEWEFLAYVVMNNEGDVAGDSLVPQMEQAFRMGEFQILIPEHT